MTARGAQPPAPAGVVEVEEDAALAWVLDQPKLEEDVLDLHAILLVHMERRGVRTARLSGGCLDRLRLALTSASDAAPTEFHFFSRAASGFTDEQITRVFTALHDDAPGFAKFVRSRVRISRKKAEAAGEDSSSAEASRDLALRYERYLERTAPPKEKVLNIEMAEGGCSMQTLFDGEKGVSCSQGGSTDVDASGSPRARFVGAAGR